MKLQISGPKTFASRGWAFSIGSAVLGAAALLGGGCSGYASPVHVRLIAINDFHGNFIPPASSNGGTLRLPNGAAGQSVAVGGAAYLAAVVKNLKAENPNSMVVGAGDIIGASAFASLVTHDEATIDILNNIGLEVTSVGNHEFDRGRTELLRIQNGGCFPASGLQGVAGADTCLVNGTYAGAQFKYLAANVVDAATGKTLFPSTYIKRFGSVSVGFIGLTFQGTPNSVTASGVSGLQFNEESAVINQNAAQLKAAGVNAVVVLLHQGGQTSASTLNDKTCPGLSGDITSVVDKLSSDVDVIVSGHTHQEYVCNYFGKTAQKSFTLTSAGFNGGAVSAIDLVLQPGRAPLVSAANTVPVIQADAASNATLPPGFKAVSKDAAIDALVTKYVNLSNLLASQSVGRMTASINRAFLAGSASPTRDDTAEGPLGDLMADTYLEGVPGGADMAFINSGAVRADLTYAASGDVTYAALNTLEPFGSTLTTLTLTGAQIVRLLEQQWESPNNTAKINPATGTVGRLLQVSKGLTYTYDNAAPAGAASGQGNRLVAGTLKLNGVLIDPVKTYKVVTNNYLAGGGDNFVVMTTGANINDTKINDLTAFIDYLTAHSPVSPPAARVTRLN